MPRTSQQLDEWRRDEGQLFETLGDDADEGDDGKRVLPSLPSKDEQKEGKKKKTPRVTYWVDSKYDLVHTLFQQQGWKETSVKDNGSAATAGVDLIWIDTGLPPEVFSKMKPYAKANHFVGMSAITRKNSLGRNLLRMRKVYPQEYDFFPDTWILPMDVSDFRLQFNGKKTFIIKPDAGSKGKGIFLLRDVDKIPTDFSTSYVAQRYLFNPYLLDGCKFDLRLYVLCTGCDPLRLFLHEEGLVRMSTIEYKPPNKGNLANECMHLTNYAINVKNPIFQENGDPDDPHSGHKRSYRALLRHLESEGEDVQMLQKKIDELIVKTMISIQPSLAHVYHSCQPEDYENSMCFEILGFDVMIDSKLKPWLIEVNQAPSFGTESELDYIVKSQVVSDALTLLRLNPEAKENYKKKSKAEALARQKSRQRENRVLFSRTTREEMAAAARDARELAEGDLRGGMRPLLTEAHASDSEFQKLLASALEIWETLTGTTHAKKKEEPEEQRRNSTGGLGPKKPGTAPTGASQLGRKRPGLSSRLDGAAKNTRADDDDAMADMLKWDEANGTPPTTPRPDEVNPNPPKGVVETEAEEAARMQAQGWDWDSMSKAARESIRAGRPLPYARGSQHKYRPYVQVGEMVLVQTSLGWERARVLRKYPRLGAIDIMFQDGDIMERVAPRVTKERDESVTLPPAPQLPPAQPQSQVQAQAPATVAPAAPISARRESRPSILVPAGAGQREESGTGGNLHQAFSVRPIRVGHTTLTFKPTNLSHIRR